MVAEALKLSRSCLSQDTVAFFEFNEDGEFISLRGGFDAALGTWAANTEAQAFFESQGCRTYRLFLSKKLVGP